MELDERTYEAPTGARMEPVIVQAERRRRWTDDQKLAIVRESLAPGAIVTLVAKRWGIGTGLIYTWRRQLLSAATDGFIPCEIVVDPAPAMPVVLDTPVAPPPPVTGTIEVELPGGAKLRITGTAEAAMLRLVLDALGAK